MLTRHAIQVLRSAGHTQKEISELTGVSEREVRRIEAEPTIRTVEVLRRLRADGYDGGKSAVYEPVRSLRPLKVDPSELALRYPVTVGPTGMVQFDGAVYSMPAEAVSVTGTLFRNPERVRIVAGRHQAEHPRLENGQRSVLTEHRSSAVAAVVGRRPDRLNGTSSTGQNVRKTPDRFSGTDRS